MDKKSGKYWEKMSRFLMTTARRDRIGTVIVGLVIIDDNQVLMTRRNGIYAIPGGILEQDEDIEHAVKRISKMHNIGDISIKRYVCKCDALADNRKIRHFNFEVSSNVMPQEMLVRPCDIPKDEIEESTLEVLAKCCCKSNGAHI